MRVVPAVVALSMTVSPVAAQSRPQPDQVPAGSGNVVIAPVAHATVHLTYGPTVILIDPTLRAGWVGAAKSGLLNYEGLAPANMILVTDTSGDHFDASAIATLRASDYKVAVPAVTGWQWPNGLNYGVFGNGRSWAVGPTKFEAVPMYNILRGPTPTTRFHDRGGGNGYLITLGGIRIYVSGETECTPEMRALTSIDVAFLAMNPPYSATPQEAADCARVFKPKVVYPYHYGGQDVGAFVAAVAGSGIEVRTRDWYAAVKPAP